MIYRDTVIQRYKDTKKVALCIILLVSQYLNIFVSPAFASDKLYFIHTDHLGSTVAVTDENGEIVSQSRHFPYGEDQLSAVSGQLSVTERSYTSQIKDSETQLYYYNARYYDPALGTFVSADPTDDFLNRFGYVGGNPINAHDPSGHDATPPFLPTAMRRSSYQMQRHLEKEYGLIFLPEWEPEWWEFRNGSENLPWNQHAYRIMEGASQQIVNATGDPTILQGIKIKPKTNPFSETDYYAPGHAVSQTISLLVNDLNTLNYWGGPPTPALCRTLTEMNWHLFAHEVGHTIHNRHPNYLKEFEWVLKQEGIVYSSEDGEPYTRGVPIIPDFEAVSPRSLDGIGEAFAEYFAAYTVPSVLSYSIEEPGQFAEKYPTVNKYFETIFQQD